MATWLPGDNPLEPGAATLTYRYGLPLVLSSYPAGAAPTVVQVGRRKDAGGGFGRQPSLGPAALVLTPTAGRNRSLAKGTLIPSAHGVAHHQAKAFSVLGKALALGPPPTIAPLLARQVLGGLA